MASNEAGEKLASLQQHRANASFMAKEPFSSRRSSYGWILVGALGLTTILSYGTTQYLFGTLVVPVSDTFHWNRASISSVYAVSLLLAGLLGVPVGYLVDRYGARLLMTLGSLLGGLTFFGLASAHAAWQFALLWAGGMGLAMALFLYPVTFTVITTWFEQGRGKAFAVLTFLGGLASPIFFPLAGALLPMMGWRSMLLLFGGMHLVIAVPLHGLLLRRAPRRARSQKQQEHALLREEGMTARQALHQRPFWTLTVSFAIAMLGNTVLFTHQVAHLIQRGYDPVLAATLAGGLGLASLPGRVGLNLLSERISPRLLLGLCHVVQALGVVFLILAPSVPWLLVYVLLYGAAFGAISPLKASVVADYFGKKAYGAITALQGLPIALCTAAGPVLAGWLYDLLGRYDLAFWLCAGGFLLAGIGIALTPPARLWMHPSL
ncbi:MFS transporter [Ktedonobacter robiniae]|uniref:MFS transporter n=1 Tax=Ktedonobacter robiniae TaxID=2778365 RepID=A0ABQ3UJ37_9CHLR|nr:MFS transporter [Ktedonobacter robiniae]GHO52680.1 MFS transporter [Ktedonobacter robiniae]